MKLFAFWAICLGSAFSLFGSTNIVVEEDELVQHLTAYLQTEHARERGEVQVKLTRRWNPLRVASNDVVVKVLEFPVSGLNGSMVLRVQILSGKTTYGPWQIPVQIKLWRDVLVAKSASKPGTLLPEADLATERRDVLNVREPLLRPGEISSGVEIAENIPAGSMLLLRAVRLRPIIRRGQLIEAQLQDHGMTISLKVEALENGAPGQVVRVRNPISRKEFKGKVCHENLVQVVL